MLYQFLEREHPGNSPRDAVTRAVQKTLRLEITSVLTSLPQAESRVSSKQIQRNDYAAVYATSAKCQMASARVLLEIAQDRSAVHFFDRYILFSAWEQDTPRDRMTLDHAYFLVRDASGIHYIGSPANYSPESGADALKVHSGSISDIAVHLHPYPPSSLCRWPKACEIEKAVDEAALVVPCEHDRKSSMRDCIRLLEMRSVHARTAGVRIESEIHCVRCDFTWLPPAYFLQHCQ